MADKDETGRTQPEFSPGERLAAIEAKLGSFATTAELNSLDESVRGHWRLDKATEATATGEIEALRRELSAALGAIKEAVNKAEAAQLREAQLTREQTEKREGTVGDRLLALERNESKGGGAKEASQRISDTAIAWLGLALIAVALIVKFA